MAEGVFKSIENFLEKEVEIIEDGGNKKSVYSERFKGDVLGKHDPYDEDNGDHEVHASESAVSDPDHNAEWFPAVKGAGKGKAGTVLTSAGARSEGQQSGDSTAAANAGSRDGARDAQAKGAASDLSSDASGGDSIDAAAARGRQDANPNSAKAGARSGGQQSGDPSAAANAGSRDGADSSDLSDDNADAPEKDSTVDPGNGSSADPDSIDDSSSDPQDAAKLKDAASKAKGRKKDSNLKGDDDDVQGPEAVADEASPDTADADLDPDAEESDSQGGLADTNFDRKAPSLISDLDGLAEKGKNAKVTKETLRGVRRTLEEPHKLYKDPERLAAARSGDPEKIKHSLKRYGRSVEPKDDSDPQDVSADPKKLKDIRANPNKAIRGMIDIGQQYGKDPFDGIDPADVQEIMEHHAAEHPHRKHKAPYVPPSASVSDEDGGNSQDDATGASTSDSPDHDDASASSEDGSTGSSGDSSSSGNSSRGDSVDDNSSDNEDGSTGSSGDGSSDDTSSSGISSESDSADDDSSDDDSTDEGDETPTYPKLDEAQDLDPDNPRDADGLTPKRKKKKRSYPKPYTNNDDPNDLQLACDSLNEMAAAVADDDEDTPSDDAPLHKKKAYAAKKMVKCLNRIRSFQQDPEACEGAFVDEASEEGAEVAGLTPDEIEQNYYGLKEVSTRYKDTVNTQASDTGDEDDDEADSSATDDDQSDTNTNDDDDDSSNTVENDESNSDITDDDGETDNDHPHKKKKRSRQTTDDYYANSAAVTGYSSNVLVNTGGDSDGVETPDIEMSLPSNQFPDTVVSTTDTAVGATDAGDQGSSDEQDVTASGDGSDPVSQISGMVSGFLSGGGASDLKEEASEAEEAAKSIKGAAGKLSKAEGAAKSIKGAAGKLSKAEGELSKVEAAGSKAKKASSKIKGLKGAKANYSKMINLCSNPMDDVTEAENVLSGVSDLAQHPDAVINQANALISAGQAGISALASAKSPEDAMGIISGMAAQLSGGGSDDDSADDASGDSDGSDSTASASAALGGSVGDGSGTDDGTESTPEEFANAGKYGDE